MFFFKLLLYKCITKTPARGDSEASSFAPRGFNNKTRNILTVLSLGTCLFFYLL